MRVAIFGDSFAVERILHYWPDYAFLSDFGKPWAQYLRQLHPDWQIDNYAKAGTCFYYSYKKYLDHRDQYDKISFVGTDHRRISKVVRNEYEDEYVYIGTNIETATFREKNTTGDERLWYRAVQSYLLHIQDDTRDEIIYDLMYQDIKKDTKVFFIWCFNVPKDSVSSYLENIQLLEERAFSETFDRREMSQKNTVDMRYNHMTGENNKILASKISQQIKNGHHEFGLNIKDYVFDKDITSKHFRSKKHIKKHLIQQQE